MERGELERMGDSLTPGAIIELLEEESAGVCRFLKPETDKRKTAFRATCPSRNETDQKREMAEQPRRVQTGEGGQSPCGRRGCRWKEFVMRSVKN